MWYDVSSWAFSLNSKLSLKATPLHSYQTPSASCDMLCVLVRCQYDKCFFFRWQPNIKYIYGYGCLKIVDKLDLEPFHITQHKRPAQLTHTKPPQYLKLISLYWCRLILTWSLRLIKLKVLCTAALLSTLRSYFSILWHFYGSNISCMNLCGSSILQSTADPSITFLCLRHLQILKQN